MSSDGYRVIDTKKFEEAMSVKGELVSAYDKINSDYDSIINRLNSNWRGKGAEAFADDARKVRDNIGGIYDTLKIMCDTLTDCHEVFSMSDRKIGDVNRNPFAEGEN